jgi:NADPH:quinone reductase-like Zn-dependent oxidoreductase
VLPPEVFADLVGYVERGEISPVVARTFPLEELAAAQAAFMTRQHIGAIVIVIAT